MGTGASIAAVEIAGGAEAVTAAQEEQGEQELYTCFMSPPAVLRKDARILTEWVNIDALPAEEKSKYDGVGGEVTDFNSWNYNIWALNDDDLVRIGNLVFVNLDMHTKMGVDVTTVSKFFKVVEALMNRNNNDYHCFHHVVDVMHSAYLFLKTFGADSLLSDLEQFSLVTAAVVHDLDHPGTNNTYHVNKHTPLAIVYNDTSILESYHCARAFELFSKKDYDVLKCLDATQRKESRRLILMCIMATDMVLHFGMKANLDKLATKLLEAPLAIGTLPEPKERDLVLQVLLHAADVSNPAKQWDVCKEWSDHVIAEFFAQGDMEKEEKLPVSMNCDRDTTFQDELSMNFSDFIVGPFYISIANLLPKAMVTVQNLKDNRDGWFSMYKSRVDADNADENDHKFKEKLAGWNGRAVSTGAQFDASLAACTARLNPTETEKEEA